MADPIALWMEGGARGSQDSSALQDLNPTPESVNRPSSGLFRDI